MDNLDLIESDLNRLNLSMDRKVQVQIEDTASRKLIGGKYPRRKRLPNMFQLGEYYDYMYRNGELVGVEYWDMEGMHGILSGLAREKSKTKLQREQADGPILEEKDVNEFTEIENIKAEVVSRSKNSAKFVFHFQPNQQKRFIQNMADRLEIHPLTDHDEALKLLMQKPGKTVKEYVLGNEKSARLKRNWKYSLVNLLEEELRVVIELTHTEN